MSPRPKKCFEWGKLYRQAEIKKKKTENVEKENKKASENTCQQSNTIKNGKEADSFEETQTLKQRKVIRRISNNSFVEIPFVVCHS